MQRWKFIIYASLLVVSLYYLLWPHFTYGQQFIPKRRHLPMAAEMRMPIKANVYSQIDPKWRDEPLGITGRTLGSDGCLITALAMGLANYAINQNPKEVKEKVELYDGVTNDGYLVWSSIEKAYPNVTFYKRLATTNEKASYFGRVETEVAIENINALLRYGQPVLLHVDNRYDGIDRPTHWVLVTDTDWTIHEPWGGKVLKFHEAYGDPKDGLYGYAAILGQPIEFPDGSDNDDKKIGQMLGKATLAERGVNTNQFLREIIDLFV